MNATVFAPGPDSRTVRATDGSVVQVPSDWELLPPGDPMLTRRVKAAGPHWVVQEKRGRKMFSRGIWASAKTIERLRAEVDAERSKPGYAKRIAAGAEKRATVQTAYVEDFHSAVVTFLNFHGRYAAMAERFAEMVTKHATPVGSGTVARTQRIPIERRAEAAVIAWMRHQTTGYDTMKIARVKGERREVRRMLAARSRELLNCYRTGSELHSACPLMRALHRDTPASELEQSAQSA
jgi:hypothetical protein